LAAADHIQAAPPVLSRDIVLSPRDHSSARWRPGLAQALPNRADIVRACEERWDADERTVNFFPATGDSFIMVCAAQHEYQGVAFAIPQGHLQTLADAENLRPRSSLRRILTNDDVVLESCMDHLMAPARPDGDAEDLRKDEVARRLVLRLYELSGAGTPD